MANENLIQGTPKTLDNVLQNNSIPERLEYSAQESTNEELGNFFVEKTLLVEFKESATKAKLIKKPGRLGSAF